ncbi:class I SAM-dependent methyltransferase [Desulfogranum japonicum]|uniref:class I SAM-dependent methyltransferase n=1 Tax=Desulfogranum japonicum TaxID=231447 RepID=UPI00042649A8|nr:class I SAM-dependent methyltransferase [Desulfogranum japonicum]
MKGFESDNSICSHRYAFTLDNIFRRMLQPPGKMVGQYITQGDTIIDLGCGPGFFTLPMAEMTGEHGKVIAVDLQAEMLSIVDKKLTNTALRKRVFLHQCQPHSLDLSPDIQADFILAYYMVHETPDQQIFFRQVQQALRKGGKMLVVEPHFHVNYTAFGKSIDTALENGFSLVDRPRGKGGKSALLAKTQ